MIIDCITCVCQVGGGGDDSSFGDDTFTSSFVVGDDTSILR